MQGKHVGGASSTSPAAEYTAHVCFYPLYYARAVVPQKGLVQSFPLLLLPPPAATDFCADPPPPHPNNDNGSENESLVGKNGDCAAVRKEEVA